jgi:hypothetical protein
MTDSLNGEKKKTVSERLMGLAKKIPACGRICSARNCGIKTS